MQEKIMQLLKKNQGFLSGEAISRDLHISRAGIWKHIREFRRQGYKIEAVPHLGYRIDSVPDKMFPWEIKAQLKTKNLGQKIIYHETISSTMDEAFALGVQGAEHGTLVCCETQTRGRGRMGRSWVSVPGKGVYASVILRPQTPLNEIAQLTLVSAVALCEALRAITGLDVRIKWPNDLLISGRKVAGILTELHAEMDRVRFVIMGFGINVNSLETEIPELATSLQVESHREFLRVEILQTVLQSLEQWLEIFSTQGFTSVRARWKTLCATLGEEIRFVDLGVETVGKAVDISEDGYLLVEKAKGVIVKKISGDIIHLNSLAVH